MSILPTLHTVCPPFAHECIWCWFFFPHFLPDSVDDVHFAKYFQLIERLVQQVVLQQDKGYDPDTAVKKMDVKLLVQQ